MSSGDYEPNARALDWFFTELSDAPDALRYQITESLIQKLLQAESGSSVEFPSGRPGISSRFEYDFRLPGGIHNLVGPTAVEVVASHRGPVSAKRLTAALNRLHAIAAESGDNSCLLIYPERIPENQWIAIKSALSRNTSGIQISVWDHEIIKDLADRHPQVLDDFQNTSWTTRLLLPLREEFNSPEYDWHSRTTTQIDHLKRVYHRDGITLLLGAGVSASAGLPAWDSLLSTLYLGLLSKSLSGSSIEEEELTVLAQAAADLSDGSPLLGARYLRQGLDDDPDAAGNTFQQELSQALYRGLSADGSGKSELIATIARLAKPKRTKACVHSVITYNFDDLFENELDRGEISHRSIYSSIEHADPEELPVYHVHGFLPRQVENYSNLEKSLLAFSEEGYHELFRNPYHWTNIVQINAFRETTCILIGLSLTDPNLRRLLEFSKNNEEKPRHFAFMKRHSLNDLHDNAEKKQINSSRKISDKAGESFLRLHHILQENVLKELGVEILWFESYSDLPRLLGTVMERTS